MKNTITPALEIIIPGYRMHTQMFDNALQNISEPDAKKRMENNSNHVVWMAGNLVNCRYWLANILGLEDKDPNEDLFKEAKALDDTFSYPSLETLKKEWHIISPKLYQKLTNTTASELQEPFKFGMDVDFIEENKLNMVGMCIDRESYLFGQVGLMRRLLGLPGMSYEINKSIDY